jgi:hypothetical protein
MFGDMPAYGFYVRHAKNVEISDVQIIPQEPDARPPIMLEDVKGAEFENVKAQRAAGAPMFVLRNVTGLKTHRVQGVADVDKDKADDGKL